jgi:hypothetical protein
MLHQVSVPSDAGISQAATEAALPPLDPQGILFFPHGFIVFLKADVSVLDPIANSSILSFQIELIQAFLSFVITLAS